MNQDELNKIRMAAGIAPKYDRAERLHLEEASAKKTTEHNNLTEAANNRPPSTVINDIARHHLNIRSLAKQNNDDMDFHEVSVWAVEAALKAAFKAGQASVKKMRKAVKEGDESQAQVKKAGIQYDPKGGEHYPVEDGCDPNQKTAAAPKPKKGGSEDAKSPKNKTAKQVSEAKKADKDYDGDGKVESSKDEHKGARSKAIKDAMDKNAKHHSAMNKSHKEAMSGKKKVSEANGMDLEFDMGDEEQGGPDEMKQRRLDLIRRAAEKVRGVDVGDEMDDDNADLGDFNRREDEYDDEDFDERDTEELSGDMNFGGEDMGWNDEEDCEYAMTIFQPEDEEAFAAGFDAFRKGQPNTDPNQGDFHGGYETARMTRMSSVAEASSEGYQNPKGKKLKADPKSGATAKTGCAYTDKPHKENITGAKPGLKKIKEGSEDATVFDKDYHRPPGANGVWDMAENPDKPHVQDGGQMDKVRVPADVKKSLKDEISNLREDAGKVRYRDEYRADFYENTADVFEMLLKHLEEGTRRALLLAQIDMNRVMSPMINRIPRNAYMYIVRGGKPASLNELFYEVKVKAEKGADPSKEDYCK